MIETTKFGPVEVSSRQLTACSECQRRKQKCSREWPCNHCRSRKVIHLCHFGSKTSPSSQQPTTLKRHASEAAIEQPFFAHDSEFPDARANLIAWGYMPETPTFNVHGLDTMNITRTTAYTGDPFIHEVADAVAVLPERCLIDLLVQNFLHHVNYFYYTAYPPQFLDDYAHWWSARIEGKKLSPVFTCLLVRVCAYTAQYLTQNTRQRLETELGESIDVIHHRYHEAAETLSRCFRPGKGGLLQVQQLFLTATYYKTESMFVEAWHSVSAAIREAQEIGLHKDSLAGNASEFDMEMRRRLWCMLYLKDWQISSWLGRPLLIQHRSCAIETPTLQVEESDQRPGMPSPFAPIRLEYQLAYRLTEMSLASPEAANNTGAVLDEIEKWTNSLPNVFSIVNPDTSWDAVLPYVKFQRAHLHATAYMSRLAPLKPYLTKDISNGITEVDKIFRIAAIDTSLGMIQVAKRLYDVTDPAISKAYIVTCVFFDTAATMSSAIMHDTEWALHRRSEVLDAIEDAWQTLQQLNNITKLGTVSCGILNSLIRSLPLAPHEEDKFTIRRSYKKLKKDSGLSAPTSNSTCLTTQSSNVSIVEPPLVYPDTISSSGSGAIDQRQYFPKDNYNFLTVDDYTNLNFDGLETVWNWQDLNLSVSDYENGTAGFELINGYQPSITRRHG